MNLSHTIANYLNGNYLLANNQNNTLITIEYPSQFYQTTFNLLNYQLFNHLKSTRPIVIIDIDSNFHRKTQKLQYIFNDLKIVSQIDQVIQYENNIYLTSSIENTLKLLKVLPKTISSLEILVRGIEIEKEQFTKIKEILQYTQLLNQITLLLPQELITKEVKQIQKLSDCRIIIEQLIEAPERVSIQSQEYRLYDILTTMILKKQNGHSFLKQYLVDGKELMKHNLKINKYKKIIEKREEVDYFAQMGTSFKLQLKDEEKLTKDELDHQINPYKQIMTANQAPLIYMKEGDEQRIILDQEEVIEEDEEYEG